MVPPPGSGFRPNWAMRKTVRNSDGCIPRPVLFFSWSLNTTRPDPCHTHRGAVKLKHRDNRSEFCPKVFGQASRVVPKPFNHSSLPQEFTVARDAACNQCQHPSFTSTWLERCCTKSMLGHSGEANISCQADAGVHWKMSGHL